MSRVVIHKEKGPIEVKEASWVCRCGLSVNQPLCDGSHKRTQDEEEGKVSDYDKENRVEVIVKN